MTLWFARAPDWPKFEYSFSGIAQGSPLEAVCIFWQSSGLWCKAGKCQQLPVKPFNFFHANCFQMTFFASACSRKQRSTSDKTLLRKRLPLSQANTWVITVWIVNLANYMQLKNRILKYRTLGNLNYRWCYQAPHVIFITVSIQRSSQGHHPENLVKDWDEGYINSYIC